MSRAFAAGIALLALTVWVGCGTSPVEAVTSSNERNSPSSESTDAGNPDPGIKDAGVATHATLLNVSTEPSGPNCAYGGERIDSGLDLNDNGGLDANEITSTKYVCNGAPAAPPPAEPVVCVPLQLVLDGGDKGYQCYADLTWQDYRPVCQQLGSGADLFWFDSAQELTDFQADMASGEIIVGSWIGYTDADHVGTFVDASGHNSFDPTKQPNFWAPSQPDDALFIEFYAQVFNAQGQMNDVASTGMNRFPGLCRVPAGSLP